MSDHGPQRTDRVDFRATSDPALSEAADRGEAKLLSYRQLYSLWERQHWAVQDLDFTQDRIDWHERIDAGGALRAHVRAERRSSSASSASRPSSGR